MSETMMPYEEWSERRAQSDYNGSSFIARFFINRLRRRDGKPPLRVRQRRSAA